MAIAELQQPRAEEYPVYRENLFSVDALREPFEHYRAIRNLGPVVRLENPDVYAISRYADVQNALRSPEVLISGKGVGFNDHINAIVEQPPVIQSDGDRHRRLRSVLSKPLMPAALKERRSMLLEMITTRIEEIADGREFDAVTSIAQYLPLQAVSHLVGLPEEGREEMLRWAAAFFNSVAPLKPGDLELETALKSLLEVRAYLESVNPARLRPGSWADQLVQAAGAGKLKLEEARAALSGLVIPSLDTTIYAKGNLLYNLGRNPDQWALLRSRPEMISSAVLEGVRYSAVVRWFARVAATDYISGGVQIPQGARVMLMYGSANRDPQHYPDPDRFDITRNPVDQLGWGTGPHICVGMHLARLEMEVMLEALVSRVKRIEVGVPILGANRGLYGFDSLPMRMYAS